VWRGAHVIFVLFLRRNNIGCHGLLLAQTIGCSNFPIWPDAAASEKFLTFLIGHLLLICHDHFTHSHSPRSFASFSMMPKSALLCVLAALMLPQLAQGHGYISSPAARSFNPNDGFYDDPAGNGAGPSVVFNPSPGICGDPFQGHASNFAGTVGPIRGEHVQKLVLVQLQKVCPKWCSHLHTEIRKHCVVRCRHSTCLFALVHRVVNVAPQPFMLLTSRFFCSAAS
jgi:hypothetical protein